MAVQVKIGHPSVFCKTSKKFYNTQKCYIEKIFTYTQDE